MIFVDTSAWIEWLIDGLRQLWGPLQFPSLTTPPATLELPKR